MRGGSFRCRSERLSQGIPKASRLTDDSQKINPPRHYMLSLAKSYNHHCGKMLTITSVQSCCHQEKFDVRTVNRYPIMQGPNFGRSFIVICRLMCLLVGLVFAAPVVLGGEPGKANDLTGVWTQTLPDGHLWLAT